MEHFRIPEGEPSPDTLPTDDPLAPALRLVGGTAVADSLMSESGAEEADVVFPTPLIDDDSQPPLESARRPFDSQLDNLADVALAAKGGNKAAFETLVRETYGSMFAFALSIAEDTEDAREIVQEAYLRAYKGIKNFRGEARFSSWMRHITSNCAITYLGKRTRRQQHEELHEDPGNLAPQIQDPDAEANLHNLRIDLKRALAQLPTRLQAVIKLRDERELTHEEIGIELDITETAAKVRLCRARARLRTILSSSSEE